MMASHRKDWGKTTGRGSLLKAPLRAPPFPPSPIPDDVIGEKIESKSLPVFIPGLFHLICYQSSSDIKWRVSWTMNQTLTSDESSIALTWPGWLTGRYNSSALHTSLPSPLHRSNPLVPASLPSPGGDVVVYVKYVNQPSLPTPFLFCSCVYFCLYGAFGCISFHRNSTDNSPLSHPVLAVLFLPYWSSQLYISLYESLPQPWYIILRGWLGLKHPAN